MLVFRACYYFRTKVHVHFYICAHPQSSTSQIILELMQLFIFFASKSLFSFSTQGCVCSDRAPEAARKDESESAERRKMKGYSQVFVILIDVIQLQNVRMLD